MPKIATSRSNNPAGRPITPIEQRFWSKVKKTEGEGCWEWQANKNHRGYGQFRVGGRDGGKVQAHRVAYELVNGPIPQGMVICHRCDNRACVRPDHLVPGTQKENVDDMHAKGRGLTNERHPMARLTPEQVAEIRASYVPYKTSQPQLAKRFGISVRQVANILSGNQWKGVS